MRVQETSAEFALGGSVTAEGELVQQLRAGSVEAFNYLISVYHEPIYHLVYRILGDAADAADTVQEIFLKVFRAASRFEGKSSLKTGAYSVTMSACMSVMPSSTNRKAGR